VSGAVYARSAQSRGVPTAVPLRVHVEFDQGTCELRVKILTAVTPCSLVAVFRRKILSPSSGSKTKSSRVRGRPV
jgi:hypothetical protein